MVDLESVLIWRDSGLSINREVLESVFEELERRFDVVIDNQNVHAASKSIMPDATRPRQKLLHILNVIHGDNFGCAKCNVPECPFVQAWWSHRYSACRWSSSL